MANTYAALKLEFIWQLGKILWKLPSTCKVVQCSYFSVKGLLVRNSRLWKLNIFSNNTMLLYEKHKKLQFSESILVISKEKRNYYWQQWKIVSMEIDKFLMEK